MFAALREIYTEYIIYRKAELVNSLESSAFRLINFGVRIMSSVGAAAQIGKNRSMVIRGGKIEPPSDQV